MLTVKCGMKPSKMAAISTSSDLGNIFTTNILQLTSCATKISAHSNYHKIKTSFQILHIIYFFLFSYETRFVLAEKVKTKIKIKWNFKNYQ